MLNPQAAYYVVAGGVAQSCHAIRKTASVGSSRGKRASRESAWHVAAQVCHPIAHPVNILRLPPDLSSCDINIFTLQTPSELAVLHSSSHSLNRGYCCLRLAIPSRSYNAASKSLDMIRSLVVARLLL